MVSPESNDTNLLNVLSKYGSVEGAYRSGSSRPYRMAVVRRGREVLVLATSLWMRTELECLEQLAEQLVAKDTEVGGAAQNK